MSERTPAEEAGRAQQQRDALRLLIRDEWQRAISDAGFESDQAAYWLSERTPAEILDRGAMYFMPHQNPHPPHALRDDQYAEATSAEFRNRHRIVVHLDYELPAGLSLDAVKACFAALLRHELEHARQQEAPGGRPALEIDQALVDPVLSQKVGGLTGGAVIYNSKPAEMDANAAAASYVGHHFATVRDELLDTGVANLVRSNTGPEDPSSLLTRTVCFLFQFRSIAERLAHPIGVEEHLRVYDEDAADLWRSLASA